MCISELFIETVKTILLFSDEQSLIKYFIFSVHDKQTVLDCLLFKLNTVQQFYFVFTNNFNKSISIKNYICLQLFN